MGKFYAIEDIRGRLDLLQSVLRDWKQVGEWKKRKVPVVSE